MLLGIEMNLDADLSTDGSMKKEWKSFYYPNYYHTNHGLSNGVPISWSNGVINNNNLLSVGGGFSHLGATPQVSSVTTTNSVQCLLFGVMGLVTFLMNSVMALLISLKLPGLDGLLGGLLGGVGLNGLGALNKQENIADTKGKRMEYVHFPKNLNNNFSNTGTGDNGSVQENLDFYEKNL